MSDVVKLAREEFETWLQGGQTSWLQGELAAWQARNFGVATAEQLTLGVCEEAGELAHAVLKGSQKIRGYDDEGKLLDAVADALADIAIYSMQVATTFRLNWRTLVEATAEKVMQRDWRKNSVNADKEVKP